MTRPDPVLWSPTAVSAPDVAPVPSRPCRSSGQRLGVLLPEESKARRKAISLAWVFIVIGILLAGTVAGSSYYFAPIGERARHPLHLWLRPAGYVGQAAGVVAFLIFVFLWLYPLRKRFRWLAWTGAMSRWLDVHVSVGLLLPVLTAVHAAWRFDGVIGLGYWSMLVVGLSGIVGRYLYIHIPRSAAGLELTAEEIAAERHGLIARLAQASGIPAAQVEAVLRSDPMPLTGAGIMKTVVHMLLDDVVRRRAARALRRIYRRQQNGTRRLDRKAVREVVRLANREMALTQQVRMLEASRAVFRYWHVAHRPFAFTALVAVLAHVGVVVAMGATWFW